MRHLGFPPPPRRRIPVAWLLLLLSTVFSCLLLLRASLAAVHPPRDHAILRSTAYVGPSTGVPVDASDQGEAVEVRKKAEKVVKAVEVKKEAEKVVKAVAVVAQVGRERRRTCATVEEMGKSFGKGSKKESLRVREMIKRHFDLHGAARVRGLPPGQFCKQGFVIGKASEAGFGNEMYKILTAAALSVMLNRSLIIGQNRGLYPFGEYISYSNLSFTLGEVVHLWKKNDCSGKYGRDLVIRTDNFNQPTETSVLCSDWRVWKQPIVWFQGTTDSVAIQFFLKNIHPGMRNAALNLFGKPESIQSRPNVFGELMRVIISPTQGVKRAVDWVLKGVDPDVSVHMRMLSNRSVRVKQAAVRCLKKALYSYQNQTARPRVVLVSDTPSIVKDISASLTPFAEVLHFNYKLYKGNISGGSLNRQQQPIAFRLKDWGPAPRWVALVDFFLAARAKTAVISGARRRVGTTYVQLIATLAAANQHGDARNASSFSFLSSFSSDLLTEGLRSQGGWGHIWNRFGGPLSCRNQPHQCAITPLLPSAWWDGEWQSPIPRDVRRLQAFGVRLTDAGKVIESSLQSYCRSRKPRVRTVHLYGTCKNSKCA